MHLTPWTLYWITRLDGLKDATIWLILLLAFAAVGCLIFAITLAQENEAAVAVRWARRGAVVALLVMTTIFGYALIPTTKQAAVIVVVPAIVNSEAADTAVNEAGELYQMAKQWLKKQTETKEN